MSVTAIIPVHNRADLLEQLLRTMQAQTTPFAEIIAIDNASTDNAASVAKSFGCRVVSLPQNTGFAHAVNTGWRMATHPWVAILNTDVELDSQWLETLLASPGDAAFACGTIFNATQRTTIDGTYDLVSRAACAWRSGFGEIAATEKAPKQIGIAPATACLYRRDVLERLAGFDETFGSYLEDVDLGLRCIRQGVQGIYVPAAVAWHHGSATKGRWHPEVVRLISRNQWLLATRHCDRADLWPIIAGQLLWGLVALRHGAIVPWALGKLEGLRRFALRSNSCTAVQEFFIESEREIRQRNSGYYWRWYFRLAGRASGRNDT